MRECRPQRGGANSVGPASLFGPKKNKFRTHRIRNVGVGVAIGIFNQRQPLLKVKRRERGKVNGFLLRSQKPNQEETSETPFPSPISFRSSSQETQTQKGKNVAV